MATDTAEATVTYDELLDRLDAARKTADEKQSAELVSRIDATIEKVKARRRADAEIAEVIQTLDAQGTRLADAARKLKQASAGTANV